MSELRELPPTRSLPAATRAAHRATLEAEVGAGRSPRRRWTVPALAVGVTVVVIATTGGAIIQHRAAVAASNTRETRCYSVADVGSDDSFKGTLSASATAADGSTAVTDPIELCGGYWRAGIIQAGKPNAQNPSQSQYPVPALVACTLPSGVAAIFPGDATLCDKLGLAPLSIPTP